MKTPAAVLGIVVSACAGGAAGWWIWPEAPARAQPGEDAIVAGAQLLLAVPPATMNEPKGPLADLARGMAGAELAALQSRVLEVQAWKDPVLRETALDLLCRGMVEMDGKAALKWARRNPGDDRKCFVRVLRAWAEVDPDAAMRATYSDTSGGRGKESRSILVAHMASVQPAKFFEHATPETAGHDVYVRALQTLAGRDPDAARSAWELLDAKTRARLTGPLAEGWARRDAETALTWARALPEPDRKGAIYGIVTEIGPDDAATALREAEGYLKKEDHAPEWVVKAIARGLAREDPKRALEWVLDYAERGEAVNTLAREVLPLMAADDAPDAGARIAQTLDPFFDDKVETALKEFLAIWQPRDPEAQIKALWNLPPTDARSEVVSFAAEVWAVRDAAGLLEATRKATEVRLGRSMAWALGNHYNAQRDEAGLMAVLPHVNPNFSAEYCRIMSTHLTWEDPERAAAFAAALPPDSLEREQAFEAIGKVRGAQEPQTVLAWAATLSEEDRGAVAGQALMAWSEEDPLGASQWVAAQPAGEMRDSGATVLAANLMRTEPDSAFVWLQSVRAGEPHDQLFPHIFSQWVRTDPSAARQALEEALISEPLRQRMREQFHIFIGQQK
jgi:hypothetical protein